MWGIYFSMSINWKFSSFTWKQFKSDTCFKEDTPNDESHFNNEVSNKQKRKKKRCGVCKIYSQKGEKVNVSTSYFMLCDRCGTGICKNHSIQFSSSQMSFNLCFSCLLKEGNITREFVLIDSENSKFNVKINVQVEKQQ